MMPDARGESGAAEKMAIKEIVPPEPHSTGNNLPDAWRFMPRWLRVVLLFVLVVTGVLILVFVKR
jgi:hypothetical protein